MNIKALKAYARLDFQGNGATRKQWLCLNKVWQQESHWNYKAIGDKTSNGRAYGIAQALPANKMSDIKKDWHTNPYTQILWGIKYIRLHWRMNACAALRNERVRGYY